MGSKLELQQLNLTLYEGLTELQILDKDVLDLILEIEEYLDVAKEMVEDNSIRTKIQTGLLKMEAVLNLSTATAPAAALTTPAQRKGLIASKFPKLQLQSFSGDAKCWQILGHL